MQFNLLYLHYSTKSLKPFNLDEMIVIARKLANGFSFERLDLYDIDGIMKLCELTFHTEDGFEQIIPHKYDLRLSELLKFSNSTL